MAGQRHDQWQIDPGEFRSPDNDNTPDPHLHADEKQKVAQTRHDERTSKIPRRGDNPALADLKARREAAQQQQAASAADVPARADDAERTE